MSYTNKTLALVWVVCLGLFGLSASGMVAGPWLLLLVAAALATPPLILVLARQPLTAMVPSTADGQGRRDVQPARLRAPGEPGGLDLSRWENDGGARRTPVPGTGVHLADRVEARPAAPTQFRLRAVMRQGTAASVRGVWDRHATSDAARAAVRGMYADDRVLRVLIVTDEVPPRFVDWVER